MIGTLRQWAHAWFFPKRSGAGLTPRQRDAVKFYVSASEARTRTASGDALPEMIPVSVSLLRDAVRCLLMAQEHAEHADLEMGSARLDEARPLPVSSEREALVRAALAAADVVAFERWKAEDLTNVREALEQVVAALRARIDLRTDASFRRMGIARIAIVGLLVLYGVVSLGETVFSGTNIARGMVVTASSRHPGTPDPSGLVDGVVGGTYGAHTQVGGPQPAWVVVDLRKPRKIRRIVVFNRGDQNLDQCLPYVVSVSDDGQTYREIATRATHFGSGDFLSSPWKIETKETARYVRVEAHDYVALSELQVYE